MKTRRVWRLEDVAGVGPYDGGWMCVDGTEAPHRPCPANDGLPKWIGNYGEWVYGCHNEAALYRWFQDDIEQLQHYMHAHISVYEVPLGSVRVGLRQLVFYRADAKLLDRFHIREWRLCAD